MSLTITSIFLVLRLWVTVKVVSVLFPIVSSYETPPPAPLASAAGTNLVPLNFNTWSLTAPLGSISIPLTLSVVDWTLATFIVLGKEKVYAPVEALLVTVIWLAVPLIEDINAAPDYWIGRVLIKKFSIGVVYCNFSVSQSWRSLRWCWRFFKGNYICHTYPLNYRTIVILIIV